MDLFKIGIDLGGTKIEAVLLDEAGNPLHRKRIATPSKEGYDAILNTVNELIIDTSHLVPKEKPYTVGVGIPGSINPETGLVQNANTTSLIGKPFHKDLETLAGRDVGMENDANCFTLTECKIGAAKGYGLVFGIIMGTGCGGGICINGNIWRGPHAIAGEWGHISVDPAGAPCYCGNLGCVETKISGSGVENAFFKKHNIRRSMYEIVNGYRKEDTACTEAFLQFIEDFGRCLGGLISMLDPDAIVLGGGLSNIDELYGMGIDRVRKYAFHKEIKTPILKNKIGDSAGVFGAAWIGK